MLWARLAQRNNHYQYVRRGGRMKWYGWKEKDNMGAKAVI